MLVYTITCLQGKISYYITPLPDISCSQDPCLTLSQLAAKSIDNQSNVLLIFLSGNHSLDRELTLSGAHKFSMESLADEPVLIECRNQSDRLVVSETKFASITGLHFSGCGGNTITTVEELVVEDSTFQDVEGEGRGTALVLNHVNLAKITECLFISNKPNIDNEHHYEEKYLRDLYKLCNPQIEDNLSSVGGAISIAFSNVSFTNTKFAHNKADIGGALLAYQSIITTTRSIFSNNWAVCGGAMFTVDLPDNTDNSTYNINGSTLIVSSGVMDKSLVPLVSITGCTFSSNDAFLGGVMHTSGGLVNITSSTFSSNDAYSGGVMDLLGGAISITNSTFTLNNADKTGGVMVTSSGLFSITNSTFTSNTATFCGVLKSLYGVVNITNCTFTRNTAFLSSGVVATFRVSLTVTSSIFNNNTIAVGSGGALYTFGGSSSITNSTLTYNNAVPGDGGVIYTLGGSLTISSSTFTNNNAAGTGGVILTFGGSIISITCTTFSNNTAATFDGGVIFTSYGSLSITRSTVTSNKAARNGGVIFFTLSRSITEHY